MFALRMRDADLVKYLYFDFLAASAPYRASRVVVLFRLCNFVVVLLYYTHIEQICTKFTQYFVNIWCNSSQVKEYTNLLHIWDNDGK